MVHKQILAGASLETGIPPNKVEKLRLRECKWLAQGHSEQRWGGVCRHLAVALGKEAGRSLSGLQILSRTPASDPTLVFPALTGTRPYPGPSPSRP